MKILATELGQCEESCEARFDAYACINGQTQSLCIPHLFMYIRDGLVITCWEGCKILKAIACDILAAACDSNLTHIIDFKAS